jgi:hypothetical protein
MVTVSSRNTLHRYHKSARSGNSLILVVIDFINKSQVGVTELLEKAPSVASFTAGRLLK